MGGSAGARLGSFGQMPGAINARFGEQPMRHPTIGCLNVKAPKRVVILRVHNNNNIN